MRNQLERKLATSLICLGVFGFLSPFLIFYLPAGLFDNVELPNSIGSVAVTAPDGRAFVASEPFGRVQRYGPDGFELGFRVASQGGAFEIGVSPRGEILICSTRAKALITYS